MLAQLTLLDLMQCFFWAFGAFAPLAMAALSAQVERDRVVAGDGKIEGSGFWVWAIAFILQGAVMICAYKAGGVR